MFRVSSARWVLMCAAAVLVVAFIASPAFAQANGMVKGKVVDEKGQPIEGAKITITSKDPGVTRNYNLTSNKKGEYTQVGIPTGQYQIVAEKEKVGAQAFDVRVRMGEISEINFKLLPGSGVPVKDEATAQAQALFEAGVTASKAADYDTAMAKFEEAAKLLPSCYDCYSNVGQAAAQKKDYVKSEEAFKKALEMKADYSDAYNGLATIYNAQRKFDEAAAASKKAAEIAAATPAGAAGAPVGGNANALYNQGVIAWNAGKATDAKGFFEEALKTDPNHAAAHYQLGMCLVNLGKLSEAAGEFDTYMKLAPDGEFAATAKAMLSQLPKK